MLKNDAEVILVDEEPLRGMSVCNVPVGTAGFVGGYLEQRCKSITRGFAKVNRLLDPGRWPHLEIPARQIIWVLTLVCFQSMGDYWL